MAVAFVKKIVAAENQIYPGKKAAVRYRSAGPTTKTSTMADKRKCDFTFLLKTSGKRKFNKVEVFSAEQWGGQTNKYRLRINGKWHDKKKVPEGEKVKKFYYRTEIRDMLWRSINF